MTLRVTISTDRLQLRPLTELDVEAVYSYASLPETSRFTTWNAHESPQDTLGFLRGFVFENYQNGIPDALAIEEMESGVCIGSIGCNLVSKPNQCMEIGFVLHPDYSGKGFATEASRAMLAYCFERFKPERIQGRCHPDNLGSVKVMERSGMSLEGRMRRAYRKGSDFWDLLVFSKLRGE